MMPPRTFEYKFSTPMAPGEPSLYELTTGEIAVAAVSEIIQIGIPASPFDIFVDQLLVPGDERFIWRAQLGNIRETKTALSGLFGRFIARAYLTKEFGFTYFESIGSDTHALNGWPNLEIRRVEGITGDLPDWIVASGDGANDFAIAEAKGSHNARGPGSALVAARAQTLRINLVSHGQTIATKRFAIATRWAVEGVEGLHTPLLHVHDPEIGEREANDVERQQIARSVALGHYAALAKGMGLPLTAAALRRAKASGPSWIDLPRTEYVEVESVYGPVMAAAVCPTGVIPLPREGDLTSFGQALLTIYRDNLIFVAVPIDELQMAAMMKGPMHRDTRRVYDDPRVTQVHGADGMHLIPGREAVLGMRRVR